MFVNYKGFADARELTAADARRAGVESGKKLTFRKGQPLEVDDAVGEALLSSPHFAGEFEEAESDEPTPQPEVMTDKTLAENEQPAGGNAGGGDGPVTGNDASTSGA